MVDKKSLPLFLYLMVIKLSPIICDQNTCNSISANDVLP
jgi:hypothetical protein